LFVVVDVDVVVVVVVDVVVVVELFAICSLSIHEQMEGRKNN